MQRAPLKASDAGLPMQHMETYTNKIKQKSEPVGFGITGSNLIFLILVSKTDWHFSKNVYAT
jgi:hypothetical protein